MGNKRIINTSLYLYETKEEIPLYKQIHLKKRKNNNYPEIIIKEVGKENEHYSFYEKNGKIYAHKKDEKTGERTLVSDSFNTVTNRIFDRKVFNFDNN